MTSLNKSQKPSWVCADGATATENDTRMIMKIMVTAVNRSFPTAACQGILVPRTVDERLMLETKPLSSGCPKFREEMWPLCSDQREKKEAGKNTNHSITCLHLWSSCHVSGSMFSTRPVSHL